MSRHNKHGGGDNDEKTFRGCDASTGCSKYAATSHRAHKSEYDCALFRGRDVWDSGDSDRRLLGRTIRDRREDGGRANIIPAEASLQT